MPPFLRACAVCFTGAMLLLAQTLSPDDVQILGDLDYGQSSGPVEYSPKPRYRAFVFTGKRGDRVEATVSGSDRKAVVAIADGALRQLASGTTKVAFTLPDNGPDAEAYYVVFRDSEDKPARFTVELKRVSEAR